MEITPEQLRSTRKGMGLTARMAAASIRVTERTWQGYEAPEDSKSFRAMPAGLLELFCIKHGLPYPPLRLDGSPTVGKARIISILSGTGGSGKTPITLELARALANSGKRTAVVTDSSFGKRERFAFQNPRCLSEPKVALSEHEARDIRVQLLAAGVIDSTGATKMTGIDLFIYQGELDRLATKESPVATLAQLKTESDFIFLDISRDSDTALLVSDIVVFVIDLENPFACHSAMTLFASTLSRNAENGGSPKLFSLLTNKKPSRYQDETGNYHAVQSFGPQVLNTTFSTAHMRERRNVHRGKTWEDLRNRPFELLVDAAPTSMASLEYHSLANELMQHLGMRNSRFLTE